MPYEVIEHTADIKIRVWGDSLENLFSEALAAMMDLTKSISKITIVNSLIQRRVEMDAPDKTALLVDFLSEALALSQTHKEIYTEVEFEKFDPSASSGQAELAVTLRGIKVDSFDEDIKAVTYHEANVQQNEKREWETVIVFDI